MTRSTGADRGSGRGRAILAVLVVALVAGVLWWSLPAARAADVHVLLDAGALSCEGTSVSLRPVPSSYGPDVSVPMARITEEMRCTLSIRVENRSAGSIAVERIHLPVLGPEAGAGVHALVLEGLALEPVEGEIDAVFVLDEPYPIDARRAEVFDVVLGFRRGGCTSEGGSISFPQQPTVTYRVAGRSLEASYPGTGFGFLGTPLSSCDE